METKPTAQSVFTNLEGAIEHYLSRLSPDVRVMFESAYRTFRNSLTALGIDPTIYVAVEKNKEVQFSAMLAAMHEQMAISARTLRMVSPSDAGHADKILKAIDLMGGVVMAMLHQEEFSEEMAKEVTREGLDKTHRLPAPATEYQAKTGPELDNAP